MPNFGPDAIRDAGSQKTLKKAQIILLILGGFIVYSCVNRLDGIRDQVHRQIEALAQQQKEAGQPMDPAALKEMEARSLRIGTLVGLGFTAFGVAILALAWFVKKSPVRATVGALVVYLLLNLILAGTQMALAQGDRRSYVAGLWAFSVPALLVDIALFAWAIQIANDFQRASRMAAIKAEVAARYRQ